MNIYAISPTNTSIPSSVATFNTFPTFFYLKILTIIIIFVLGLFIAVKYIEKDLNINKLLRFTSFLLAPIGIIVFFMNLKDNKRKAIATLKITIVGITTFILMFISTGILTYIEWII